MGSGHRILRIALLGIALLAVLVVPPPAIAGEKHEGMHGMNMADAKEGHGGMMKMGDKVWSGKLGPWHGEARLMDMKAHMEKAKASGMKMEGMMKSHHIAFEIMDPGTGKPVTAGKGAVYVTGPDKKEAKSEFIVMQGHFGADINLPAPGKYAFRISIESGGKKGSANFSHTVK